jgi:hypothetical protein
MAHWSQGVQGDSFQMYDYGHDGNIRHYNQPQPPKYVQFSLIIIFLSLYLILITIFRLWPPQK